MKKTQNNMLFALTILVMLFASCENSFTTDMGIEVTTIRKGNGGDCTASNLMMCNVKYQLDDGTLLMESEIGDPVPMYYDTSQRETNFLVGLFDNLTVGDSITFALTPEFLWEKTMRQPIPDTIDPNSKVVFYLGVVDQMNRTEFATYRAKLNAAQMEEIKMEQKEKINKYLSDNGIEANESESGLRYVINKKGNGKKPNPGDEVSVHYTGMLLDGTVFDSSEGGEPLQFELGVGRVIKGWDEGIGYLGVGDKGTLYVPSDLAYGSRGAGRAIPPHSILIFEVELVAIN